jgi:hypothetical protein
MAAFEVGQRVWVEPAGWWATIELIEDRYVRIRYLRGRRNAGPVHAFHVKQIRTEAEHRADLATRRRLRKAIKGGR